MIKKIDHYSITHAPSIYDEEAMTALELAGRTAGKINEVIDAFNQVEGSIDDSVAASVSDHIKKGSFDAQIDQHTKALTRDLDKVEKDVEGLDKRVDNLILNGSENSPEVIDIRQGADGKVYDTAGGAVRAQLREKVGTEDFYTLHYETGSIGISNSGWDYSEEYGKNSRVRIKEGRQLKLSPGDIIGLTSYEDARMYLGFRIGGIYTWEGWLTEDYTVTTECECVILLDHAVTTSPSTPNDPDILGSLLFVKKMDSTAGKAERANENIENSLDIDLQMVLGGMDIKTGVYGSRYRFVTRDILKLPIDIVLKRSDKCRMGVFTYSDTLGSNAKDLGWVTDKADYIITAGTCFRVMVMTESYEVEAQTDIDAVHQYDSELYKAIRIEPLGGKGINLMHTARTLGRIASIKALTLNKRSVSPRTVRAINHRGFNLEAPENTLKAYKKSKAHGFNYVECDVRFSSDDVPVLFHDDTVDRISDGTGRVCDKTLAQLKALNIGGERIATFDEFISLCASLQLHAYIEIEPDGDSPLSLEQTKKLMAIVDKYGMRQNVSWISFTLSHLMNIVSIDPYARVGFIRDATATNVSATMQNLSGLYTGMNEVFLNIAYQNTALPTYISFCSAMFVPVEVWTINSNYSDGLEILENNPYISGVTSDDADIGLIVVDNLIEY